MIIKLSLYLFLIVFSFYQTGCYLNANISDLSKQQSPSSILQPDTLAPIPSTPALTLALPGYQIYDDSTPSFEASNFTIGHRLKLYRDNTCTTEVASTTVSSNPQVITVSPALADGVYQFSAKSFDASSTSSSCVVLSGNYELNTQTPTLTTITPVTLPTFTGGQLTLDGSQFVMGTAVSFVRADGEEFSCQSLQFVSTSQITCTAPGFNEAIVSVKVIKPVTALQVTLSNALTYIAPLPTAPVCFDGGVQAIANDSANTTCMGGGIPISKTMGIPSPARGSFPEVAGTVNAVISDNNGGYFIGGDFQAVGGQVRHKVAHILSDLSLDPNIGSDSTLGGISGGNGTVKALAFDGSQLYLGGDFTTLGKTLSSQGAMIDTAGNINLNQIQVFGGGIVASVDDGAGGFYIGGDFTWVGGIATGRLAHIKSDGTVDLTFLPAPNNVVNTLAVSGSTVYAAGGFTSIGGQARNRIAALDSSGNATSWNPDANGTVSTIAVSGSTVYAGGSFTSIGGQTRNCIAAIDSSGNATSWNPIANSVVYTIAVSGSTVYAGGNFTSIGGQSRNFIAAIDSSGNAIAAQITKTRS